MHPQHPWPCLEHQTIKFQEKKIVENISVIYWSLLSNYKTFSEKLFENYF
jgi:hypothetical protein